MPFLSDVYTTLHHEMHTLLAQFPPRCEVCLEPGDQLGHVDQSTCPAFQGAPLLYSFQRAARPDVYVRKILDPDGSACEIGRAHVELQSLMRISYAVFCLK